MAVVKGADRPLSRSERARRTRSRIIEAAYRLFLAQGYEATTMQAVSEAAGVAIQTVYLGFRTKAQLLAEVENLAVLGGVPSERWRDQPWAGELRRERDPRRVLEIFVSVDAEILDRIASFVEAVGASAMPSDATAIANRDRGRDEFFGAVIDRLEALNALSPVLTTVRALDIARVIVTVEGYVDLTKRRGWSKEDWRVWMCDLLAGQMLARK